MAAELRCANCGALAIEGHEECLLCGAVFPTPEPVSYDMPTLMADLSGSSDPAKRAAHDLIVDLGQRALFVMNYYQHWSPTGDFTFPDGNEWFRDWFEELPALLNSRYTA